MNLGCSISGIIITLPAGQIVAIGAIYQARVNSPLHYATRPYRYFLNVLAVTASVSANSVAKGNTMKVGCRLKGKAR